MEFSSQNTGVGSLSLLQGIFPTQGLTPGLPHCKADSLPAEPQGKPKHSGVGSRSLLQRIFLTQESNQGLLHCRQILYQLSYQGSPTIFQAEVKEDSTGQDNLLSSTQPHPGRHWLDGSYWGCGTGHVQERGQLAEWEQAAQKMRGGRRAERGRSPAPQKSNHNNNSM